MKRKMFTSALAVTVALACVQSPQAVAFDKTAMMDHARAIPANLEVKDAQGLDEIQGEVGEIKTKIDALLSTHEEFQKKNDERLAQIEKTGQADVVTEEEVKKINEALDAMGAKVDDLLKAKNRPAGGASDSASGMSDDKMAHKNAFFTDFMTKGRDIDETIEKKAISTVTGGAGGYAVPEEIDSQIESTVLEMSQVHGLVNVKQVKTSDYKVLVNTHGATSGWVGEDDARPETATPGLEELAWPMGEIYANGAATQRALDDMYFDAEGWLMDEVGDQFATQIGAAVVNGNGTDKPKGFLAETMSALADGARAWRSVQYLATGVAGDFAAANKSDILIDTVHALKSKYRSNGKWAMNNLTIAEIRKLKDADGNYLWKPGIESAASGMLLGYNIHELPDMPDLAADSYSIAFADWNKAYRLVERMQTRVIRDPYTNKPFVMFYATKRVGGQMLMDEALKIIKFGVS